jgi:hypothetical protein
MNKKRNLLGVCAISLAIFFGLTGEACQDTTQEKEQKAQDAQQAEANAAVPLPKIYNHTQKKQFAAILEKFDEPNLITYTYLVGMHNEITPMCRSQGYGFPESEQFTNPLQPVNHGTEGVTAIGNPDPSGLYPPSSSTGTLLLCLTADGTAEPVRSEPSVLTLPVPWNKLDRTGM